MTNRKRWVGLAILTGLLLLAAEGAAWAECGTCQVCKVKVTSLGFHSDFCAVANDEDGWMCCKPESIGWDTFCAMGGDTCYGIIVDGGGGSGGGGGGMCSYQSGWCPAECMTCSGSGGRPAV